MTNNRMFFRSPDSTRYRGLDSGQLAQRRRSTKSLSRFTGFGGSLSDLMKPDIRFAPGNSSYDALSQIEDYDDRIRVLISAGYTRDQARSLAQALPPTPGTTLSTSQAYGKAGLYTAGGVAALGVAPGLAMGAVGSLVSEKAAKKLGAPKPVQVAAGVVGGGPLPGMSTALRNLRHTPAILPGARRLMEQGVKAIRTPRPPKVPTQAEVVATKQLLSATERLTELVKKADFKKERRLLVKERKEIQGIRTQRYSAQAQRAMKAGVPAEEISKKASRFLKIEESQLGEVRGFAAPRQALTGEEVASLFQKINEKLLPIEGRQLAFRHKNTSEALMELLNGKLIPKNQAKLLRDIFGQDLGNAILNAGRSLPQKVFAEILGVLGIPRAVKASIDLSAFLRQGLALAPGHPKRYGGAMASSLKSFFSDNAFDEVDDIIRNHKNFLTAKEAGLYIAPKAGGALDEAEEVFATRLVDFMPKFNPITRSQRAYVSFLNKLRFDVFSDGVERVNRRLGKLTMQEISRTQAKKMGVTIPKGEKLQVGHQASQKHLQEWASFINRATGRGGLGPLEASGIPTILNNIFFSPRFFSSRFGYYVSANQAVPAMMRVAKEAARKRDISELGKFFKEEELQNLEQNPFAKDIAKDMFSFGSGVIGALTLLKLSGAADVNINPYSSDFGKIRVGKTRLDALGGFSQPIRFVAQTTMRQRQILDTDKIGPLSQESDLIQMRDSLGKFLRGKLNPTAGFGVTMTVADRRTYMGEKVGWNEELAGTVLEELFEPMSSSDMREVLREEGLSGLPMALTSVAGVGVQSFRSLAQQRNDLLNSPAHSVNAVGEPVPLDSPVALPGEPFDPKKRVTSWYPSSESAGLERKGKGRLRLRGEFRNVDETFERDDLSEAITELAKKDHDVQVTRDAMYLNGDVSGQQWIQDMTDLQIQRAGRRDITQLIKKYDAGKTNDRETALAEYHDINNEYDGDSANALPGNKFNYEGARERKAEFLAGLSRDLRDYVIRNLNVTATDLQNEYYDFQRKLGDSGWYEIKKQSVLYANNEQAREWYDQRIRARTNGKEREWLVKNREAVRTTDAIDKFVEQRKDSLRRNDPKLDAGLVQWLGRVPKTIEAQVEVMRGKAPQLQFLHLLKGETGTRIGPDEVNALIRVGITSLQQLARATNEQIRVAITMASMTPQTPMGRQYKRRTVARWGLQAQARQILARMVEE